MVVGLPLTVLRQGRIFVTIHLCGKMWKIIFQNTNKSKKGLPVETKNTEKHENRRLDLIEFLHMQRCSLRGCKRPLAPA